MGLVMWYQCVCVCVVLLRVWEGVWKALHIYVIITYTEFQLVYRCWMMCCSALPLMLQALFELAAA